MPLPTDISLRWLTGVKMAFGRASWGRDVEQVKCWLEHFEVRLNGGGGGDDVLS